MYYENYEAVRKARGIRNSDVCRATGIRPSTMTDWKNGRCTPRVENLSKIATALGVTIDELIKKED